MVAKLLQPTLPLPLMLQRPYEQQTLAIKPQNLHKAYFVGFAYQGKDIVFRFIIKYSSLREF